MNLGGITADNLVSLYRNRDLSVSEVIRSVYEQIEQTEPTVHAFITLSRERALDEARRLDARS